MSGRNYTRHILVDGDGDGIIQFNVRVEFYYDPGRSYGPVECCYPSEWELVDSEIEDILIAGVQVSDDKMKEAIIDKYDTDWIFDEAWSEVEC